MKTSETDRARCPAQIRHNHLGGHMRTLETRIFPCKCWVTREVHVCVPSLSHPTALNTVCRAPVFQPNAHTAERRVQNGRQGAGWRGRKEGRSNGKLPEKTLEELEKTRPEVWRPPSPKGLECLQADCSQTWLSSHHAKQQASTS